MLEIIKSFFLDFWGVLSEMAPYLLFGFFVAGLLSVLVPPEIVERNLGRKGIWSVIKASLFGVPLPLCSCGVIPVAASLRRHGASRGATTGFLISTPQTGVDSILVTYSLLGLVFAIFRPIAAFVNGVIGGVLVNAFDNPKANEHNHLRQTESGDYTPECDAECCSPTAMGSKFTKALKYGFITLPGDIGKELLIGLAIAALITIAVPDDFFTAHLGPGILSMLVMMFVGLPIYVCATASVPVAAAFIAKGISPGAALVFLMTGPATNAAAIATIWKVLGRKTTYIYLATVALTALLSGLTLDYIFRVSQVEIHLHGHRMLPIWSEYVSAVVLLGILGYALFKPHRIGMKTGLTDVGEAMQIIKLKVKGMTCSHCAENVHKAVVGVEGVEAAEVNLKSGEVILHGNGFDMEKIKQAVEQAGYKVV